MSRPGMGKLQFVGINRDKIPAVWMPTGGRTAAT